MRRVKYNALFASHLAMALIIGSLATAAACAGDGAGVGAIIALEATDEDDKEDRANRRRGQTLEVEVDLQITNEFEEPSVADVREGWKEDEDNGGYKLTKTFSFRTKKWSLSTFDYTLDLLENGTFRVDYSGGDIDYGFHAAIKLPKKDGKFVALGVPFEVSAGGFDNIWGGGAEVKITVKP